MHAVVSMAKCNTTQAERSRPVAENKRQKGRNIITAAEVQKLLRVCANMPDRLTATRAKALVLDNIKTGKSFVSRLEPCSVQRRYLREVWLS